MRLLTITAFLATLIACFFVLGYNHTKYHNAVEHQHAVLPSATSFVAATALGAFLIPVVILAAALLPDRWIKARRTVEMLATCFGWLFAFAWPLLCIWAWELPFVLL
jgi:hypothetical protein